MSETVTCWPMRFPSGEIVYVAKPEVQTEAALRGAYIDWASTEFTADGRRDVSHPGIEPVVPAEKARADGRCADPGKTTGDFLREVVNKALRGEISGRCPRTNHDHFSGIFGGNNF